MSSALSHALKLSFYQWRLLTFLWARLLDVSDFSMVLSMKKRTRNSICTMVLVCLIGPVSISRSDEPPLLSLESLYHPEQKFDYDSSLPKTHWIGNVDSRLLVQRDEQWMELDLDTGKESAWPVAGKIAQRLSKLGGLNADQIQDATSSAIRSMKRPADPTVVKIDNSLAIVAPHADARWLSRDASAWSNPTIDPTGRRVGYTNAGDLFLVDVGTGKTNRLTHDGTDTILDGILDWTYQEEIFGRGKYQGFWFSPDGDWIAMLRVDISAIEPYTLPATTADRGSGLVRSYPKAGDPIPHASLWIWDLRQLDSGLIPAPRQLAQSTAHEERIMTGVWWSPKHLKLVYAISDRLQSWRELRVVDRAFFLGQTNHQLRLLREESSTWVEPPAEPDWLDDGGIIWRSELPSGRNRLYKIGADGRVVDPLSPEEFNVHQFDVRDDGSMTIVTGNESKEEVGRHVYRIDPDDPTKTKQLSDDSLWHRATISPDGKWYLDQASSPTQPPTLSVQSVIGDLRHLIQQSKLKLTSRITEPVLMQLPASDGVTLPAILIRPESATDQQPCAVVVEVYGGPQSPSVSGRWSGKRTLYRELLARRGIATLVIDNRSSAGRGSADSWPIHKRMGELEFKDTMVGVDWLRQQPWVDEDRLAIRGWSFGGFMTLYTMTHSDAFIAGIAGGSVTDWREYDAFYTERYMGLPSENKAGYDSTAPVRQAESMHGTVLMIHGESDDNVHPSGTMRMAAALQKAGKDFRLMIYPGAAHAVSDPKQAWHMVQMTDRFLIDQLGSDD